MHKKIIFITILTVAMSLTVATNVQSQVLISLVLGDKLNTGQIEFGLDGGANFSFISNLEPSKQRTGFHLGFYFDIRLKDDPTWYIHTGVIVKSPMGANKLTPYSLNNGDLDTLFIDGSVKRKLSYFNVPILIKYRFINHMFVALGPEVSLLHKATDEFTNEIYEKEDLVFTNNIRDHLKRIDFGIVASLGYRLMKGNGINMGIRYYQGLIDMVKNNDSSPQRNSSIYLFVGIPIGAGNAEEKQADKK